MNTMAALARLRESFARYLVVTLLFLLAGCDVREGWIVVRNDTSRQIVMLSVEPCGGTVPGPNRLDSPMPPGAAESFLVGFGCYDVALFTEDAIPGGWRVEVRASQRRVTLFAQDPPQTAASLDPAAALAH